MKGFCRAATVASFVVVAMVVFVCLVGIAAQAKEPSAARVTPPQVKVAEDLSAAFEHVADLVKPCVVSISSVKRVKPAFPSERSPEPHRGAPFGGPFGDDLFQRFFRQQIARGGFEQRGLGSGVVISEEGHIVTNNHVVDGADEVQVILPNKRKYKARVVGTDARSDLAVLQIEAPGLRPAKLGDSDRVRAGEWVVAIGHPFGLSHTITAGIVSAKGRANVGVADYEDFIQTDAAINPGNSGGPLVNLKGEVIGINTAIFSRSGGYMGIGFAIPSNMVKSVIDSLISRGKVVRGYLGVVIQELNEKLAKSFGYDGTQGVLVGDVQPGGPADKAGIERGDIIERLNGERIKDMQQLRSAVAKVAPGKKAMVEVFRNSEHKTLEVAVGELESGLAKAGERDFSSDLGMATANLTPDMAGRLGLGHARGVLVTSVDPFGPAAHAGIRVNDVIVAVEGKSVKNVSEFRDAITGPDLSEGLRMTVRTGSHQRFVVLRAEASQGN